MDYGSTLSLIDELTV